MTPFFYQIILSCLFSKLQNVIGSRTQDIFFRTVVFVGIICSSNERTSALGPFFYHALFPSFGIHPFRDANPGQPLGVVVSVSVIFSSKQRWSWRLSFVMLSFQPTGTALTGIRTKETFSGFWPYWNFLLASGNKHFNFGENGCIRSWAKGNIHTYPQFQPCIGL